MEFWIFLDYIVGACALLLTLGFFVYRVMQINDLYRSRDPILPKSIDEDSPFLPIWSCFINCIIWFAYGYAVGDLVIILVNIFGITTSFHTLLVYYLMSCRQSKLRLWTSSSLLILFVYLYEYTIGNPWCNQLGIIACLFSLFNNVAPLISLLRTKLIHSCRRGICRREAHIYTADQKNLKKNITMSVGISCISFIGSLFWLIHGILLEDKYVIMPNLLSTSICSIQLAMSLMG